VVYLHEGVVAGIDREMSSGSCFWVYIHNADAKAVHTPSVTIHCDTLSLDSVYIGEGH
jgi:hypothetical protein